MPELTLFNPDTASAAYFKSRHDYLTTRYKEEMPDDPGTSLAFSIKNAQSWKLLEGNKLEVWHVWEDENIVAELFLVVSFDENNLHLMSVGLQVLKPYRKRGYTKPLLEKVLAFAERHNRTLVSGRTSSFVPDSQGFAEHVGATKGLEESVNQLVLKEVDEALLETWLSLADTKAHEFELGFWGSRFPEEDLQAIADLFDVMNTAPRGDLDEGDWQTTPEELREGEAYDLARGVERWAFYARHKPSQTLAGFTVTYWYPENPENLDQNITGVLPEYRGHGLGRWLKAAMIEKVLTERPVVKRIRTGNASSNAPMLTINHELGFKLYKSEIVWQLAVAKLGRYLESS